MSTPTYLFLGGGHGTSVCWCWWIQHFLSLKYFYVRSLSFSFFGSKFWLSLMPQLVTSFFPKNWTVFTILRLQFKLQATLHRWREELRGKLQRLIEVQADPYNSNRFIFSATYNFESENRNCYFFLWREFTHQKPHKSFHSQTGTY